MVTKAALLVICLAMHHSPSPLPRTSHEQCADHAGSKGQASNYGDAHESFFLNLVVHQRLETQRLHVVWFKLEQDVVVSSRLGVVAQLVVAHSQVVEAFAPPIRRCAEDIGQKLDTALLLLTVCGFYEALAPSASENQSGLWRYPGVVELCLNANVLAFFFVLRSENGQLGGLQGTTKMSTDVKLVAWHTFLHLQHLCRVSITSRFGIKATYMVMNSCLRGSRRPDLRLTSWRGMRRPRVVRKGDGCTLAGCPRDSQV